MRDCFALLCVCKECSATDRVESPRRAAGEHVVSLRNQKAFMESQVRMMIMLGIPFFYYWRRRDWRFEVLVEKIVPPGAK